MIRKIIFFTFFSVITLLFQINIVEADPQSNKTVTKYDFSNLSCVEGGCSDYRNGGCVGAEKVAEDCEKRGDWSKNTCRT